MHKTNKSARDYAKGVCFVACVFMAMVWNISILAAPFLRTFAARLNILRFQEESTHELINVNNKQRVAFMRRVYIISKLNHLANPVKLH